MTAHLNGSKKEFWGFFGQENQGKKQNISSLNNVARVSVTSTKDKHYEHQGRVSVDIDFYCKWKEVVETKVSMCSSLKCMRM